MLDFAIALVNETARVLYDGSLFILIGFAIAGLIHEFLPGGAIVRHLGDRSLRSAGLAALLGAPIPLCSCGVLPTAVALRRKGASREASLSFLITTPETGIDSVALTSPTSDRLSPCAARRRGASGLVAAAFSSGSRPDRRGAGRGRRSRRTPTPTRHVRAPSPATGSWTERILVRARLAVRYAFVDLFDELGFWLVVGDRS